MTPLQFAIVITMILMVISLIVAGVFLAKDKNKKRSKRTLYALGARITFAVILMLLATYGIVTGELRSQAPWSYSTVTDTSAPSAIMPSS